MSNLANHFSKILSSLYKYKKWAVAKSAEYHFPVHMVFPTRGKPEFKNPVVRKAFPQSKFVGGGDLLMKRTTLNGTSTPPLLLEKPTASEGLMVWMSGHGSESPQNGMMVEKLWKGGAS